jgi:hypothetical protein
MHCCCCSGALPITQLAAGITVEPGSYVTGVSTSTYAFGIAYIDGFWGFGVFAADLTERIWRWDELQNLNGETAWRLHVPHDFAIFC